MDGILILLLVYVQVIVGRVKNKGKDNAYMVYTAQSAQWGKHWYDTGFDVGLDDAISTPHCNCYEECNCNQCTCDSMCCVNDCQQLTSTEPGEI